MKKFLIQTAEAALLTASAVFYFNTPSFAQNTESAFPGKYEWLAKEPFKNEVFIENNGQFNHPGGRELKNIRYAIVNGGLKVYFAPSGLTYHVINIESHFKNKEESHEVFEEIEEAVEKNEKLGSRFDKYFTDKSAYVNIEWEGAHPDVSLLTSEKVHDTYSYSEKNEKGEFTPILADAFKKLTYKNIYPNIDIEFYFPDDLAQELKVNPAGGPAYGIKYNIIVHPGGDVSQVKMKYSGMQGISLDEKGNIVAAIPDGNITDHAPDFSFVGSEDNQVKARFILQGQTMSFEIPDYDKTQKLVIDPFISAWNISPGFTTTNDGYTLRVDYNQNVYVMGGGINKGGFPLTSYDYEVKKFNSAGVLQWTAATSASNAGLYGDMVVLRSGRAIVGHGFGSLANAYIINPANGAITTVSTLNEPGWRLSYSLSANDNVLWIGGGSNNGAHLYKTDTNLVGATAHHPWTTASNTEDISYLAQDKAGAFVYCTNASSNGSTATATAPKFIKAATGTPGAAIWKVNEPTVLSEAGQGSFINGGTASIVGAWATGVNGMVVCNDRIYTFDGTILRAYDAANGNILNTATVPGGTFDKNSGIDVDNCCRVYVGSSGTVKRYTSNLTFDVSIPVANTVYDLRLDPLNDDIMFVTGKGFVQRIDSLIKCSNPPTVTALGGTVCTGGCTNISASPSGGTPPYTYLWSPGGYSTQTANVCPTSSTIYTVTITDGTNSTATTTASVTITSGISAAVSGNTAVCMGDAATLTAAGGGTYSWSTGATGSSISVTPASTSTYSVIVSNGNCSSTASVTVVVRSAPAIAWDTWSPALGCDGYMIPFKANVTNGMYTYWNFGDGTNWTSPTPPVNPEPHTYLNGGTYTVTVLVVNQPCRDSLDTTVVVTDVGMELISANVFTPNGDNRNDCFHPSVFFQNIPANSTAEELQSTLMQCVDMEIFDRWGIKMFTSTDNVKCWDGRLSSGLAARAGTYYYIAKFKETTLRGFIELVR